VSSDDDADGTIAALDRNAVPPVTLFDVEARQVLRTGERAAAEQRRQV
jgi:hypothetical protein